MTLEDINLLDSRRFAQSVPHEWFTYLRRHAPVYRHPERHGPGFWAITRHDDVRQVSGDPATFSSAYARGGVVALREGERMPEIHGYERGARNLIMTDPPEHTQYRMLANKGFTVKAISTLQDHIRAYSGELLDRAIATGRVDWVDEVAAELPIRMISELLGVPAEDRHKMLVWSNQVVGSADPEYAVGEDTFARASAEVFAYAEDLAAQRRREPRDDIVSILVGARGDQGLPPLDFRVFFMALMTAGNETTRYTAAHGMKALVDNPDQYAALAADPGLIPGAVEEMLRWATAIHYFRRTATRDTEIRGVPIKAGDKVVMYYTSANRDEEVFENPFRFDIRRNPNPHVAFGAGGPHFCIGASLSRLQLRVLFEELVRRAPTPPKAAGEAVGLRSLFINGVKHLPVDFTGGGVPLAGAA